MRGGEGIRPLKGVSMALSDALKDGPAVMAGGTLERWFDSLDVASQNALLDAAHDPAWTHAELFKVARAHGLPSSLSTFKSWRNGLRVGL